MNKKLLIISLLVVVILISGCVNSIQDVKSDKYIGQEVTVKGTVEGTLKIGTFSGYSLKDKNGDEIGVVSDALPEEGTTKRVSGTIKKLPIVNVYYLDTN